MTFNERLNAEKQNLSGTIFLYEDGSMFVRAMERSAFMFCQVFRFLVPVIRNNRDYGGPYASVGFPKEKLSEYTGQDGYSYQKQEDGSVTTHVLTPVDTTGFAFPEEEFLRWKNSAIAAKGKAKTATMPTTPETPVVSDTVQQIISDIMRQNLADYTPMKALNYLNTLQERIRHEGIPYQ